MLSLPSSVKIYLSVTPTDMRKGFSGLSTLVKRQKLDLYSGHLFAFINKRGDRIKILTWDRGGFVIYYKHLAKGRFLRPARSPDGESIHLDAGQLAMLLDGVNLNHIQRQAVWQPPSKPLQLKKIDT